MGNEFKVGDPTKGPLTEDEQARFLREQAERGRKLASDTGEWVKDEGQERAE